MADIENDLLVTFATVKLIPSTVIEPFSTIYLKIFGLDSISNHIAFSSFVMELTLPCPSTCPETMCPPNLEFTAIALSRFTLLDTGIFKNPLLSAVSCIIST